jgi:inner membrane protein
MVIFIMALGLWIPTFFIMELIREREGRQREAIADISSKWAGQQTITGPLLVVPYIQSGTRKTGYFLPDQMEAESVVQPEKRNRGIYQVAVYRSQVKLRAGFNRLKWEQLNVPAENILWNEAALILRVSDNLRGLNEDIFVEWNNQRFGFNPQVSGQTSIPDAFVASVPVTAEAAAGKMDFQVQFTINGSEQLLFHTIARDNKVRMSSSWVNPSFTGVKLPENREVTEKGFNAEWKLMNRSIPPVWANTVYDYSPYTVGTDFMIAVDSYDKTERSVKYALLCIILTFASFFLIETIYKRPLHLVQYGLAGLALVLFYTLLLSISEYTGFNLAYLVAGVATIGLVTWYVGGIMKSGKLAMFIGFVLAVVYSYIFTIIQLQDYALLMGSIGLFLALAIIMYFSRKITW